MTNAKREPSTTPKAPLTGAGDELPPPSVGFSFPARFRSMFYAQRGIRLMLRSQHNAWIHAAATMAVITAAFIFKCDRSEWCWLVIAMMSVWTAEALNTAFEFLCDVASPAFHPTVEKAKDVAAGGVLISAIGAAVIGAIVFWPHLFHR
jgi:diacylglycerol kinase (ATP)